MPLDRFGVLVGTLHRHFRDRPDDQGRWFHVNLEVDAPAGRHRCAVDVDRDENGMWQDGATLTERPDRRFDVFVSKFSSQASRTDDDGHPAP